MSDRPEKSLLSAEQLAEFRERGYLHLPGFYDVEREVVPIQRDIHEIVELLRRKYGLSPSPLGFDPAQFDAGYSELIALDRRYGSEVYDAVKQIPALLRMVASQRNEQLVRETRGTDLPGIAAGGYGIRIDNPGEERFRADWHQEYHAQLRSVDGITLWTTLVPLTEEMGPVRFCPGSHKQGLLRVHTRDPQNPKKTGAYGLILENRESVVAQYTQEAPLTRPGDVVLIDYAVLHASGHNRSKRSRWSIQMRYFNFRDPVGTRMSWRGGFAAGVDFATVHPELVADADSPSDHVRS
jgi:hypothetical protein